MCFFNNVEIVVPASIFANAMNVLLFLFLVLISERFTVSEIMIRVEYVAWNLYFCSDASRS